MWSISVHKSPLSFFGIVVLMSMLQFCERKLICRDEMHMHVNTQTQLTYAVLDVNIAFHTMCITIIIA